MQKRNGEYTTMDALEELRGRARAAEVAAQLAERRAASAEKALHANADAYARALADMRVKAERMARWSRVTAILGGAVLVCTVVNLILAAMRW